MEHLSNPLPPLYTKQDPSPRLPRTQSIPRKPVTSPIYDKKYSGMMGFKKSKPASGDSATETLTQQFSSADLGQDISPRLPMRPSNLSIISPNDSKDPIAHSYASPAQSDGDTVRTPTELASPTLYRAATNSSTSSSMMQKSSTNIQKAYRETRHFAGGLIHHPAESTKHFTILRHSHGMVFYQGTNTSLAVSIFADEPLSPDRTLWLQSKGYTGKTGMRVAALAGFTGKWINITPSAAVRPEQINPNDERAWQRDIASFTKRASKTVRKTHILRETCIVRIPSEAKDGYFHLVLRIGESKKVLCTSPIFRVFSTSTNPGSVRGAGLLSLPLEVGAKVLTTTANSFIGTAALPVTTAVKRTLQPYEPSWIERKAYSVTLGNKVNSAVQNVESEYEQVRDVAFSGGVDETHDLGPEPPYPVRSTGIVAPNTGAKDSDIGLPTMHIESVSEEVIRHLNGVYFGWMQIKPSAKATSVEITEDDDLWHQAVISATPLDVSRLTRVNVSHAGRKVITLNLINDLEGLSIDNQKVEIRIMGYIRPYDVVLPGEDLEEEVDPAVATAINDVAITQAILDRVEWGPHAVPTPKEQSKRGVMQKAKSGYVETRLSAQRQIDKIPLHKAGVRVPWDATRDKSLGKGGIYIVR
jgi:hypothetical protein